jgi:ABC-2 type transport system permease protein
MEHLLRSELFRVRKRGQTWLLVAVVAAFVVLFYGGMTIAHAVRPDADKLDALRLATIHDNGLGVVGLIGSVVVAVFAASLIGSEYGWNTLRPALARARTRSAFLTAKWLTVALYAVGLAVVGVVATMAAAITASLVAGEGFDGSFATAIDAVTISGRFAAGFLPTAALAMAVALVARSNAAGIAIGITLSFVEPLVFMLLNAWSDVFATVQKAGIDWNAKRLFDFGGDPGISNGEAWTSAGVLAIWVALFVAVSYRVFARRDVTSG